MVWSSYYEQLEYNKKDHKSVKKKNFLLSPILWKFDLLDISKSIVLHLIDFVELENFFCELFWDRTVISVFHLFLNVKMTWESKKCVCLSGIMILITFKMSLHTVTEQNVTIVLTSWWDQFKYVFRMILAST